MHTTLVSPSTLKQHIGDPKWVIVDCRFDLGDTSWGEAEYAVGHIPGARYAHLDRDLSGEKTGTNGRHPLPTIDQMAARFGALGVGPDTQVVVYDAETGMHAARLWWMLRFMGHDAVALLDGGFAAWTREAGQLDAATPPVSAVLFVANPRPEWVLGVADVEALAEPASSSAVLIDARSPERFRGIGETLDKVGGHIPGARNYFFQANLGSDKRFKGPDELRAQWTAVLQGARPKDVVMYCGSGVTACHNLLAMELAGLGGARIFPGSWSEWSADPKRPVET
jgi:thiosulfate/3-mercaptopyruvate sulfurtransferase